jgi:molecular chaperone DnaJ
MDLYSVLGVSRSASADEIERAYRRLSRRYHPGVNPGDRLAKERFRQVDVAYRVLADADQRREYDRRGAVPAVVAQVDSALSFEGFDYSAQAEGPGAATFSELFADVFQDAARKVIAPDRGGSLEVTLPLSFLEALAGGEFPISIARQERCTSCRGDGRIPRHPVACPACGGEGTRRWARGHMVFTKPCDVCAATGLLTSQSCQVCGGTGVQPRSEVVTVVVPSGAESNMRLAIPGRGHAAPRGGPAGDLYVTIDVAPHPFFTRVGQDLRMTLPVAVHEAALGARVEVPTPAGPVRLRIPPGTPSGQQLRLRGRGVPAPNGDPEEAGDLIVDVDIVLPPVRDERSKELLREFGRLNADDVRRHLFER